MPDTPRDILLREEIANALIESDQRCMAAAASLIKSDVYVDESRKAIARGQALLRRPVRSGS